MLSSTGKLAIVVLLALAALGTGLGLFARSAVLAPPSSRRQEAARESAPRVAAKPKSKPPAAKEQDNKSLSYAGRVLDPDGKPVAGAKIYLTLYWRDIKPPPAPAPLRAATGPDGRFHFIVPKVRGQYVRAVVAVAAGHGPAWVDVVLKDVAKDKLELRLVKDDVPINGQVLDLQGRPVRGVIIRVLRIRAAKEENLGPWMRAVKAGKQGVHDLDRNYLPRQLISPEIPGLPHRVTTDAAGRFRLTGIGRERMVVAQIEGPTITTRQVRIVTRAGKPIEVPEWDPRGVPGLGKPPFRTCYAATCTHAAAPTKPIVGVVRDKDTNKPLTGFTIRSYKLAHSSLLGIDFIATKTDAWGRYRLTGMPKGKDNEILVVPPSDRPYVTVHAVVPDSNGLDPVTVDFALKRGVWIEGKITDKATGKPVQGGRVEYFALSSNPNLRHYTGFQSTFFARPTFNIKEDGSYRVVGMPGPGLLAVQCSDHYLLAPERDDREGTKNSVVSAASSVLFATSYNAVAPINPAPGAKSFKRDVTLDPGWTFTGTVLGPDGKPLSGVCGFGLSGWGGWDGEGMKTAKFTVHAFNPRRRREFFFQHRAKGLVGIGRPPKDKGGTITVRMQPGATVTGRLIDADGQPRPGVGLNLMFRRKQRDAYAPYYPQRIETDREGRFRIAALLPGYEFALRGNGGWLRFGNALRPDQTKDLGDVQLKQPGP